MAEYPTSTTITEIDAYKVFDVEEIGKHLSSDDVVENDIRILGDFPNVAFKICLNSFNRDTIRLEKSKSKECVDMDFLDHAILFQLANLYRDEEENVYIYTDKDGEPIFLSAGQATSDIELIDKTIYGGLSEITLKWLVEKSTENEFRIEDVAFIDQDNKIYYAREAGFAKLFVPFMFDWFEINWPGLIVAKDNENALPVTQAGFRILLQMFILEVFAWVDTTQATFALRDIFYVDIPELMSSTLGTKLSINDKQISQLLHMIPTEPYEGILEPKSYLSKNIITDVESVTKFYADEHKNVSWEVFFSSMEYFGMGCTIFLAPRQVIIDKDSNLIFSVNDIKEIKYRGPNFPTKSKRNSVEIAIFNPEIEEDLRTRLFKFFEHTMGIKVSSIRTPKIQTEYLKDLQK